MTYSLSPISLTASTTLNRGHANAPVILNAAAGLTVTLPAVLRVAILLHGHCAPLHLRGPRGHLR